MSSRVLLKTGAALAAGVATVSLLSFIGAEVSGRIFVGGDEDNRTSGVPGLFAGIFVGLILGGFITGRLLQTLPVKPRLPWLVAAGPGPWVWLAICGRTWRTYRYESGHSGDACLVGFAVRGKELVVYVIADTPEQVDLLANLGRHKMGKVCLYFKRLADLNVKVLEALIAGSVAEVRRRYP